MRGSRESETRIRGMGLAPRFVLAMTAALAVVLALAGAVLIWGMQNIVEGVRVDEIGRAVKLTYDDPVWKQKGNQATSHATGVKIFPIRYGDPAQEGHAFVYSVEDQRTGRTFETTLLVPRSKPWRADLIGMFAGIFLVVIIAGALVAFAIASRVARPIHRIIEDVRQIAKGDLAHKTHAVGSGEVELLARTIDRMTKDLDAAQDAQFELSMREREMDVASGVREALLPLTTPWVEGYDVGAIRLSAEGIGGDYHDFIELADGRFGLLVCEVSGKGVPAALVGATARSYLRTELGRGADLAESMRTLNRWLVGDVRRGMFVTVLYCLVDPAEGQASVACAGHKIPLLRCSRSDGQLRVVHPEGIALGFDKGPVFDRRLEIAEVPLEPGDRLVLTTSASVSIRNGQDEELGEKAFYARVLKHSGLETPAFLKALRRDLEAFAGVAEIPVDISFVTVSRDAD